MASSAARVNTLRHIRLQPPPHRAGAFPTYELAVRAQTVLQQRLLAWKGEKRALSKDLLEPAPPLPPPPPTLLSFTPAPTYTLGRRQTAPLGPEETARLTRPLDVAVAARTGDPGAPPGRLAFRPSVHLAPRGGLATYHGPGQLVLWPVVDLRSPAHRHLTVHAYACLLEKTTIAALRLATGASGPSTPEGRESPASAPDRAAIAGFTDPENPGVWVDHRTFPAPGELGHHHRHPHHEGRPTGEARKIAALGVHLRRHVTGLGVAINCGVAVAGPETTNPWSRIVPCGIEGKGVTNVLEEMGDPPHAPAQADEYMRRLTSCWATLFTQSLYGEKGQVVDVSAQSLDLDLDLEADGNWEAGNPRE